MDDSDLFASQMDGNIERTVGKMQELVTNWEYAAKVTGGALAPDGKKPNQCKRGPGPTRR